MKAQFQNKPRIATVVPTALPYVEMKPIAEPQASIQHPASKLKSRNVPSSRGN